MRIHKLLLLFFWVTDLCAQRFEAQTDAKTVLQGSSFQVTFNLYNAEGQYFQASDFSPFQILSGPARSMQTSIVNGRRSSSQGYVYELICNKVGRFRIAPARVRVQGKEIQSNELWIEVVKAEEQGSSGKDILIIASLDKSKVVVGEQCLLTYKLYTKVAIENIEAASRPVMDAFHEMNVNMLNNPVTREIYKGQEYMTKVLSKIALFPIKTGVISIEPVVYRLVRGQDDPFGFGMPSFFRQQIETVSTNSLELQVENLPVIADEQFSGAVGEMDMKVIPPGHRFSLNDAIHIQVQIRGNAHFNGLAENFIRMDTAFEITDIKKGNPIKITDEPEILQSCDYDYLLIPKKPGTFIIRPEFVYFDPRSKSYKTIRDSFSITIVESGLLNVAQSSNSPEPGLMDIPKTTWIYAPLYKNILTYVFLLIPISLFFLGHYRLYIQRNQKENMDIRVFDPKDAQEVLEMKFSQKMKQYLKLDAEQITFTEMRAKLMSLEPGPEVDAFKNWLKEYDYLKYSGHLNPAVLETLEQKLDSFLL
ncbi:MAG: protein BatD [Saprospiraceae bacterium]|nr:protein BatD [Saprospiraceae bacterium]